MKVSICCLLAILALTNGKPFFQVAYSPYFPATYGTYQHAPFVQTVAAVPTFKFASPQLGDPTNYQAAVAAIPTFSFASPAIGTPTNYQAAVAAVPTVKSASPEVDVTTNYEITGAGVPTVKLASPVTYSAIAPVPTIGAVGAITPVLSKYHGQSRDGSYSFGYFGGPSSRQETRDSFGNVRGAFNYIDPYGVVQSQQYVADSSGFRVAATNLPVAPVHTVKETDAVREARAKFQKTFDAEKKSHSRSKREASSFFTATYNVPQQTFVVPSIHFPTIKSSPSDITPTIKSASKNTVGSTFPADTSPFVFNHIVPAQFPYTYQPHFYPTIKSNDIPADTSRYEYKQIPQTQYPFNFFPQIPTTYSVPTANIPFAAAPIPVTYSAMPNIKPATFTHTVHGPGNTFSYRVDN